MKRFLLTCLALLPVFASVIADAATLEGKPRDRTHFSLEKEVIACEKPGHRT